MPKGLNLLRQVLVAPKARPKMNRFGPAGNRDADTDGGEIVTCALAGGNVRPRNRKRRQETPRPHGDTQASRTETHPNAALDSAVGAADVPRNSRKRVLGIERRIGISSRQTTPSRDRRAAEKNERNQCPERTDDPYCWWRIAHFTRDVRSRPTIASSATRGPPARTRLPSPPEAHLAGRGGNTATKAGDGSSRRDSGTRSLKRLDRPWRLAVMSRE